MRLSVSTSQVRPDHTSDPRPPTPDSRRRQRVLVDRQRHGVAGDAGDLLGGGVAIGVDPSLAVDPDVADAQELGA